MTAAHGRRGRWRRPAAVALVVTVLATAVALLLAQSAGAIHLSILGGTAAIAGAAGQLTP